MSYYRVDMRGVAILDRAWGLRGSLEQWRRITGVMRHELASSSLLRWTHPDDGVRLLRLAAMAEHRTWRERVRLGRYGARVAVDLELDPWTDVGVAVLTVFPVEPLPLASWWLPLDSFAERAASPTVVRA